MEASTGSVRARIGTPVAALGFLIFLLREFLGMFTDAKEFHELFPGAPGWIGRPWFGPVVFVVGIALYLWAHHDWHKGRSIFDTLYLEYGAKHPKMTLIIICVIGALMGATVFGKSWQYIQKRNSPAQQNAGNVHPDISPGPNTGPLEPAPPIGQSKAARQENRPKGASQHKTKTSKPIEKHVPESTNPASPVPAGPSEPMPPNTTTESYGTKDLMHTDAQHVGTKDEPKAIVNGGFTQGPGSIAQIGGIGNQATINSGPPPPVFELTTLQENIKVRENLYQTDFRLVVKTDTTIPFLYLRADAPSITDNIFMASEGTDSVTHKRSGPRGLGFLSTNVEGVSSGTYIINTYSTQPDKITLSYDPQLHN
jgi:hypothetical protein